MISSDDFDAHQKNYDLILQMADHIGLKVSTSPLKKASQFISNCQPNKSSKLRKLNFSDMIFLNHRSKSQKIKDFQLNKQKQMQKREIITTFSIQEQIDTHLQKENQAKVHKQLKIKQRNYVNFIAKNKQMLTKRCIDLTNRSKILEEVSTEIKSPIFDISKDLKLELMSSKKLNKNHFLQRFNKSDELRRWNLSEPIEKINKSLILNKYSMRSQRGLKNEVILTSAWVEDSPRRVCSSSRESRGRKTKFSLGKKSKKFEIKY